MSEAGDTEDVEELLFVAETLSDKLAVVSHSQTLKFVAITVGLYATALAIAGLLFLSFGSYNPTFRFADDLYKLAPFLLIFLVYIVAVLCIAFYRLSLDRTHLRLVRRRLDTAILDARKSGQPT